MGQELISKHKLPTGEVSLFANLLISRFLMGNRSYLLCPLRALKRSVEAERLAQTSQSVTSGVRQAGCAGDWHFCIVFMMQHQPFKQLPAVWPRRRVQIMGRTVRLWWPCLACRCSGEVKPCTSISMSKSAHSGPLVGPLVCAGGGW